ncbi:receptor-type tyrosine-protein phosphatase eta isoform X2 [Choloepus didactylus]|uniref:receptor-type tyrosine-protein phosphatase eta isoform X2 n=1 Tax=Choloepus didactylus TaxID=27675 RepID=UPI00189E85FC|nr:receptor-type tyrosine-protein phosphatase eta isoform X2 [Choloepus didactylus]
MLEARTTPGIPDYVMCAGDCLGCDSIKFNSTATEIHFSESPENFSMISVTNSSGQILWNHKNISFGGLAPGTLYLFHFSNGSSNCCQEVHTKPSPVFDIEAVSISPNIVTLTWKNNDMAASEYKYIVKNKMENNQMILETNQKSCNITDLNPATSYTFSITPEIVNGTWGEPTDISVTTEPSPVSGLRFAFNDGTEVALTWGNGNGTATCRMLLEGYTGSTQELAVNVTGLRPGFQYRVTLHLPESNETQRYLLKTESCLDANSTEGRSADGSPDTPEYKYPLRCSGSPSDQEFRGTEFLLSGLKLDAMYKATVYSQAADGTEGQLQAIEFGKNSSQVVSVHVVSISATSMNLSWDVSDSIPSSVYTYKIQVLGKTDSFSLTVNESHAVITGLSSSTLYNITVRPLQDDGSEGLPYSLQVYTPPGPVSDFHVMSVGIREIGLAWSSNDSESFRILTMQAGAGVPRVETTTNHSIVIDALHPGTKYNFEIFPQGPNGTEGPPQTVNSRTDPSGVFDIRVVHVNTTEMQLEWQSTDNASEYVYNLCIQSDSGSFKRNSSHKAITLRDLIPGTLYNITIIPEVDGIQGNPNSTAQYTWPSIVSNIKISTNTTAATISWQNFDKASSEYIYHLFVEDRNSNKTRVTGSGITNDTVPELIPGSSYTVKIFAQVRDGTRGAPGSQEFCTDPAPVALFHCEGVPKEPALVLRWACPPGSNTGFELEVSSGAWNNVTELESCSSENGSEYRMEVTYLNFSTSYNISITTLSCTEKKASPAQNICITGITDPPSPDESPNITSVSHNSIQVKFSRFEASHGPIKAYALILTTGEAGHPSADVLKYTYEDFKKGASDTYVTYLIKTEEDGRSQGLSEVLKYEINVGNESTTHGYYNGKLEPLGSYRACVAGFTNIVFNSENRELIDGAESYVSFSRYSDAVFLPQDPGVICGAVFGCIFGALVIMAVGGFIFWRKKRKDAKNNEVSFSQIKPKKSKLVKVENFEAYFKKQQADSNCGFAEEYEDLRPVGTNQPKYAAELAENRGKNRYNNVLPYDISRVKLSVQTHSTDDYINANYMPGYHSKKDFIATQGPLPNTLKDFWRMVWEKDVYAIVMVTKCIEQGRTKCEEYWPSKQSQDYGDITVAMTSEIVLPEWTIRDFTVKNVQASESHPLRQFHFTSWPDHGVPDATDLLINFRYLVRDYMKQIPPESPILVHCSAGVGRTGTFIAIDRLIYQIENENTVDVYGIVYDLRMHRPLMVQTEDQYVFLNQCVLDIIRSQKDSKVDLIYQNTTAMTIYENLAPVTAFGKTNGYIA